MAGEEQGVGGATKTIEDEWGAALTEAGAAQQKPAPAVGKQGPPAAAGADAAHANARPAQFGALKPESSPPANNIDMILDIPISLSVELGRTRMLIKELLQLGQGSIVELEKLAGEPIEILVNGKLIARGEAVVVNDKFGVKLTDVVSPSERISRLK
ncbi:MAG: flagellar motor switch protein FliN [Deltaproteobacteria bacterium]|nr:flagellar motor switch protein FliN [Deltaproteobacteria bacterium]